jgi:hypothetical protein
MSMSSFLLLTIKSISRRVKLLTGEYIPQHNSCRIRLPYLHHSINLFDLYRHFLEFIIRFISQQIVFFISISTLINTTQYVLRFYIWKLWVGWVSIMNTQKHNTYCDYEKEMIHMHDLAPHFSSDDYYNMMYYIANRYPNNRRT